MDNKTDVISVVIPVYNSEKTIIQCLESVYNQTFKNIEIIIVNDGSTDNTLERIHRFFLDKKINHKIINQKNKGVSRARNVGIKSSTGQYIAFIDSDDLWTKDKLEKQIGIIKRKKINVLGTLINTNRKTDDSNTCILKKYRLKEMLFSNKLYTSSVVLKKEIIEKYNFFNEDMMYSEDYNLWLNISCDHDVYVLQEILTYYDTTPKKEKLSQKIWKMEKGELSNYCELYKKRKISIFMYIFASFFSVTKFIKRLLFKLF